MKTKKLKLIQRALAALLTMTMTLGVVPMMAFAEETSQTAQEAAAMRALESRVFILGDEEKTIEDLEQADFVMVTTENGENVTLSGDEIRDYLIVNPQVNIDVSGTISIRRTSSSTAQLTLVAHANSYIGKVSGYMYCRNSATKQSYYGNNISYEASGSVNKTQVTITSSHFSIPPTTTKVDYGFNMLNIQMKTGAGGTATSKENYGVSL